MLRSNQNPDRSVCLSMFERNSMRSRDKWYARGEQVRTLDGLIDWLRQLWKLRDVFVADPAVAAIFAG